MLHINIDSNRIASFVDDFFESNAKIWVTSSESNYPGAMYFVGLARGHHGEHNVTRPHFPDVSSRLRFESRYLYFWRRRFCEMLTDGRTYERTDGRSDCGTSFMKQSFRDNIKRFQ